MDLLNINSVDEYVEHLPKHRAELNELYRDLLIGVTKFFRDPEAYATLARDVIPKIFNRIPDGQTVRAWVAGCASPSSVSGSPTTSTSVSAKTGMSRAGSRTVRFGLSRRGRTDRARKAV